MMAKKNWMANSSQKADLSKNILTAEKKDTILKIVAQLLKKSPKTRKPLKKPNKLDRKKTEQQKRSPPLNWPTKITWTPNLTLQVGLL